jgi:hypothetical protein
MVDNVEFEKKLYRSYSFYLFLSQGLYQDVEYIQSLIFSQQMLMNVNFFLSINQYYINIHGFFLSFFKLLYRNCTIFAA